MLTKFFVRELKKDPAVNFFHLFFFIFNLLLGDVVASFNRTKGVLGVAIVFLIAFWGVEVKSDFRVREDFRVASVGVSVRRRELIILIC